MHKLRIVIIGSGNVASNLGLNLQEKGHKVLQVYSRIEKNAKDLSERLSCSYTNNVEFIESNADFHLICTSDKAVAEIASNLIFTPKLIAHTAGSISVDVLNKFPNYGVFYPLQTFSKHRIISLETVPFCIEANNTSNNDCLIELAKTLSDNVFELSSTKRKQCHLAAVFANNFSNHMFALAQQVLQKHEIDANILNPLILETALKVRSLKPLEAQTGPAIRSDETIIANHLELLSDESLKKMYNFVTKSIINYKKTT